MNPKQRKNRIIIASVIALIAVLFVGRIMWLVTVSKVKVTVSEKAKASDAVLVATDITGASDRSDANDRESTYEIRSIDTDSLSQHTIGKISSSIFSHSFAVNQSNELFYIHADGQLVSHRVDTGFDTIVPIPDIKAVFGFFGDHSVKDFLLSGDTVVYFQGGCSDSARCDLKSYDLQTKKSTTILAHLEKKLSVVGETAIDLQSYDPVRNVVTVRKTRNTAANGYADLIEIDAKGVDKVTKTVEFTADVTSSPEAQAVFTKTLSCGSAKAIQKLVSEVENGDAVMRTKVVSGNGSEILVQTPSYIVGCVVVAR